MRYLPVRELHTCDTRRGQPGFLSHTSLLLLLYDSLVRILGVISVGVCIWDDESLSLVGRLVLILRTACGLSRGFSRVNCFREWWEGEFGPEDGRRKDRGGSGKNRAW